MKIGILALQGDVAEHKSALKKSFKALKIAGKVVLIKKPDGLNQIDGLVIPGGESTVMGQLTTIMTKLRPSIPNTLKRIREEATNGLPIFGTCAGTIMLAKTVYDRVVANINQPILEAMDIEVERNSYGRQRESFEANIEIPSLGEKPFPGIFIRAPAITEIGEEVSALGRLNGSVVAAQQGNLLATTFHPELTTDMRFHKFFLKLVWDRKRS